MAIDEKKVKQTVQFQYSNQSQKDIQIIKLGCKILYHSIVWIDYSN